MFFTGVDSLHIMLELCLADRDVGGRTGAEREPPQMCGATACL